MNTQLDSNTKNKILFSGIQLTNNEKPLKRIGMTSYTTNDDENVFSSSFRYFLNQLIAGK